MRKWFMFLCLAILAFSKVCAAGMPTVVVKFYDEDELVLTKEFAQYAPYDAHGYWENVLIAKNASGLKAFIGWENPKNGKLVMAYELANPEVTELRAKYFVHQLDVMYYLSGPALQFMRPIQVDGELRYEALSKYSIEELLAEKGDAGVGSDAIMCISGRHDSYHYYKNTFGGYERERWWPFEETTYSADATLYVKTDSGREWRKKLGDIVGVKPALAMGYGFDRQFSFPIDNVVPGDGYHMYCEINRGGESKSFPGVSSSGSVSFEYRLPWLDVEVSLQKWDGDSIRVDWGYYPWERVKHKEGRTFSIWRGKSSETPDKWELIAKNVAGWSYVDRTWAGRGFSKYTCYFVCMSDCLPDKRYGGNVPFIDCGGEGRASPKEEVDPPFTVAMESVDGQRLIAHSTVGSDCFWEDVESTVGLSRTMFTAMVGAIPVANESNSECYVGIAPEAGDYSFAIEAPEKWTVKSDCAWMQAKTVGGAKGSSSIVVSVDANSEGVVLSGNLVFTCDGETRTFTIVQDVMPKVLDWKIYGKNTHVEQDPKTGKDLESPCLVAAENFVIELQFNHFNRNRYPVNSLELKGEADKSTPADKDIEWNWNKTAVADVDFFVKIDECEQKLPEGDGYHGIYDFAIKVACERIGEIDVAKGEVSGKKVFFDAYGKDNGSEPNWFVYWNKDGAVPALAGNAYSGVAGAPIIHRIAELDKHGKQVDKPNAWGCADSDTGVITLYDKAAYEHYYHAFSSLIAGGIDFRKKWVFGIYTVANALAHEKQHIDTHAQYLIDLASYQIDYPPTDDVGRFGVKSVNSDFGVSESGFSMSSVMFWGVTLFTWSDMIAYDDKMTDRRELKINASLGQEYGFTLSPEQTDTFDLGTKKDSSYYSYGDNEFISMLAGYRANEDSKTAIEANDWAYPGCQSYLPRHVGRKANEAESSSKATGASVRLTKSFTISENEQSAAPFSASNRVIKATNAEAVANGEADAVRYKLSFDVTGSETMRFVGYLIDPASNVVACAGTNATLTADNNCCELAFPTNDIFRSGFSGPYTLSGMIVYRVCNTEYVCEGVYRDLVTDWVSVEPPNPVDEHGIASRYGPFVPGEKVELMFHDGAAWKVTGLSTGLKWDAKLPGVTGVPTKPGTNTVYFTWTDKTVTPNVTHKASSTFIVGPLPVLSVQTAGEGTGKVSGAGAYAANKKVTLKATADTKDAAAKGKNPATVKSVFAGWYDAAGDLLAQTPNLSYSMPPHDVTLQARFIPASNDWATADCVMEAGSVWVVSNETKVALTPISVVAAGGSLPTVKVAGLPSGLKFTAKDIMKKNPKTEVDVPANTIYGTPTKGGVYNATVTVTTAGKASVVRAIKFIIRTARDYVVDADWDPVQGKVTGVGVYQADKKVTLKATANKGYVFNGWYDGEGLGGLVTQAASYSFSMPSNDVSFTAKFVTTDEDEASISADVNGFSFGAGSGGEGAAVTQFATNVMTGVYLEWPVAASALSQPTVAVSGLPTGLKFTAKPVTSKVGSGKTAVTVTNIPPNTIYGAPTAASKTDKKGNVTPSKVKVTVTTAGKSKAEYVIDLTVDPLPAWAQGEFSGLASTSEGRLGSASMSVTAAGKVSGKVIVNGTNCTFSASSYDITSKTVGETNLVAVVTGKLGKETVTGGITVIVSGASGTFAGADMTLHRNVWKDKGAEPVPEEYQGTYSVKLASDRFRTGYLSLTVDKKGAVKVAGKAPDGTALSATATLMPGGDGAYFTDVFAAPSAYKGGYVAGRVGWGTDGRVSSDGLDWTSFNPESTADYYAGGFDRGLSASGARYEKTDAPKTLGVADVRLETPVGATLSAFSFTQSTGIWKGTLLWDFGDPSLSPVKVPFEGILVPGEEDLKGFGTYDATSSYPTYDRTGKKTGEKSYKYKESLSVDFVGVNKEM